MGGFISKIMNISSKIIGFVLVAVLLVIIILVNRTDDFIDVPMEVTDSNGTVTTIQNIDEYSYRHMKKSDWFELHFILDESDIYNQVLVFDNEIMQINIYADDELIYSNGEDYLKAVYNGGIEMVPLSTYKNSKDVRIRFTATYDRFNATIPDIQLKDNTAVYTDYIQKNYIRIGGCVILIVLGLILFIYCLVSGNFDNQHMRIIIVAAISILSGVWIMADCKIGIIFAGNYINLYYLRNISIFLSGIAFMMYLDIMEEHKRGTKIFLKISIVVLTLFSAVSVVLHWFKIQYMNETGRMYVVLLAVMMILYGIICLMTEVKEKDRHYKELYIFILLTGLISALTMIKYSFLNTNYTRNDYIVSVVVIAVIFFFNMLHIGILINSFLENNEKALLENMAYVDGLTGIYNRNMCEKKMSIIDSKREGIYGFYIFDLKGLKHVNDTYGHTSGDEMIKVFASSLKEAFGRSGSFVGRFGGDEFIVIVEEKNLNQTDAMLEALENTISSINEEKKYDYKIAFRYGNSVCDMRNYDSIWKLLSVADKNMYGKT